MNPPTKYTALYTDMDGNARIYVAPRKDCIACVEQSTTSPARIFRGEGDTAVQAGVFDGKNWFWTVLRTAGKVRKPKPVKVTVKARVPHGFTDELVVTVEPGTGLLNIREKRHRRGVDFDIGSLYVTKMLRQGGRS